MGSHERHFMNLSLADDAQLLAELDRCTVRGRKSDLLRNYALLGYQRALGLCANVDLTKDHSELTRALAELFAPDDTPPDFRTAAEFIKTRAMGQGGARQAPVASPRPAARPPQEAVAEGDSEVTPPKPRPKPQWSGLSSLVGGSSKDKEQGGS